MLCQFFGGTKSGGGMTINSKVYYVDVGAANAVDRKFKEFLRDERLSYVGFEPDARSALEFPG
jgi:hypothetical protein